MFTVTNFTVPQEFATKYYLFPWTVPHVVEAVTKEVSHNIFLNRSNKYRVFIKDILNRSTFSEAFIRMSVFQVSLPFYAVKKLPLFLIQLYQPIRKRVGILANCETLILVLHLCSKRHEF